MVLEFSEPISALEQLGKVTHSDLNLTLCIGNLSCETFTMKNVIWNAPEYIYIYGYVYGAKRLYYVTEMYIYITVLSESITCAQVNVGTGTLNISLIW